MSEVIKLTLFYFLKILQYLIVIRALLSWIPLDRDNRIKVIIHKLTEPILEPVRKLLEKSIFGGGGNMMIDFSPFIAYMLLFALMQILIRFF